MKLISFALRSALYFLVLLFPVIHPAIVVSYDLTTAALYFFLIPISACIAFFLNTPAFKRRVSWLSYAIVLAVFIIAFSGFTIAAFSYVIGSFVAFFFTLLLYRSESPGKSAVYTETVFLGFLYYKLIEFSRNTETLNAGGGIFTVFLFGSFVLTFFLYLWSLYAGLFAPKMERKLFMESILLLIVVLPLAIVLSLAAPLGLIKNEAVLNQIDKIQDEQNFGSADGEEGAGKKKGEVKGVPADQWNNSQPSETSSGMSREKVFALVKSKWRTIYLATDYLDILDPAAGFQADPGQPLNELKTRRFLQNWENPSLEYSENLAPVEYEVLSALTDRGSQYQPAVLEPTILRENFYPYQYHYKSFSYAFPAFGEFFDGVAEDKKDDYIRKVDELKALLQSPASAQEKSVAPQFLDVPADPLFDKFRETAKIIFTQDMSDYQKMLAIFDSLRVCQYKVQKSEPDVIDLLDFYYGKKVGDCSEFSQTAAILARLAGIPSRIAEGFLASKDLQTPLHAKSADILLNSITIFDKQDDIILVTSRHGHAWAQFWFPQTGWINVEATDYGLPDTEEGQGDILIPIITDRSRGLEEGKPEFRIPWFFIMNLILALAAAAFAGLYLYKNIRLGLLAFWSRKCTDKGLKALYKKLLIDMADGGMPVKPPFETPKEYADKIPEMSEFARLYTEIQFNTFLSLEERRNLFGLIHAQSLVLRKQFVRNPLKAFFSLKGLYY
jgi:transglutaminase-like putative cysteine protease